MFLRFPQRDDARTSAPLGTDPDDALSIEAAELGGPLLRMGLSRVLASRRSGYGTAASRASSAMAEPVSRYVVHWDCGRAPSCS